jgi:Fe-S cluster assembly ATP-binding protein
VSALLNVDNLHVSVCEKEVLKGLTLQIKPGEVCAIMGPNGSGKSSFSLALMGHPRYTVTEGAISFAGDDVIDLSPDKRAKLGIFLGMQHPHEIEGVPYKDFLRQSYNALYDGTPRQMRIRDFHNMLLSKLDLLHMDHAFIERSVNVGFSGGEKKRAEMLQVAVLQPKLVILDEIDSGLDIDALRQVAGALNKVREHHPEMAVILITHYQRILQYVSPDKVVLLRDGLIIKSGGADLVAQLEQTGYADI